MRGSTKEDFPADRLRQRAVLMQIKMYLAERGKLPSVDHENAQPGLVAKALKELCITTITPSRWSAWWSGKDKPSTGHLRNIDNHILTQPAISTWFARSLDKSPMHRHFCALDVSSSWADNTEEEQASREQLAGKILSAISHEWMPNHYGHLPVTNNIIRYLANKHCKSEDEIIKTINQNGNLELESLIEIPGPLQDEYDHFSPAQILPFLFGFAYCHDLSASDLLHEGMLDYWAISCATATVAVNTLRARDDIRFYGKVGETSFLGHFTFWSNFPLDPIILKPAKTLRTQEPGFQFNPFFVVAHLHEKINITSPTPADKNFAAKMLKARESYWEQFTRIGLRRNDLGPYTNKFKVRLEGSSVHRARRWTQEKDKLSCHT